MNGDVLRPTTVHGSLLGASAPHGIFEVVSIPELNMLWQLDVRFYILDMSADMSLCFIYREQVKNEVLEALKAVSS